MLLFVFCHIPVVCAGVDQYSTPYTLSTNIPLTKWKTGKLSLWYKSWNLSNNLTEI